MTFITLLMVLYMPLCHVLYQYKLVLWQQLTWAVCAHTDVCTPLPSLYSRNRQSVPLHCCCICTSDVCLQCVHLIHFMCYFISHCLSRNKDTFFFILKLILTSPPLHNPSTYVHTCIPSLFLYTSATQTHSSSHFHDMTPPLDTFAAVVLT